MLGKKSLKAFAPSDNSVSYPCPYCSEEKKISFDKNEIYGKLYVPKNGRDVHPAVILSHGFNSAGSDMEDVAMYLAENGIAAYTYDFRGGSTRSKSSGRSKDMSILTEQEDLREVIDTISSLDFCDSDNIYLYGESQGGFVSALTGAEIPEKIAGMFLVYPAFCIPDDWLGKNPDELEGTFNFMGLDISRKFFDGVPRYDVFEHVKKFTNPVLIFHGDNDNVVNLSYSERLVKCFPNARLTVVKGAGHGFSEADRLTLKKAIVEFFETSKLN